VGLESSETGEFFQSEGSIVATKSAGVAAYEKIIIPNPRSVPAMFRSVDRYTVDVHSSVDEFLQAENPMVKLPNVLEDLGRLQAGRTIDAIGVHLMTNVSGAMYRDAQTYLERNIAIRSNDDRNKKPGIGWQSTNGSRCAVYYSMPGITVSSPLDAIIKMRLVTDLADRLFLKGSNFLPLLGHMMNQLTNSVDFALNNRTVEELLTASELQLLSGINGIIAGARRLPLLKELYMQGPVGRFFQLGGPSGRADQREEMFGPEMAAYVDETLEALKLQCVYQSRRTQNAIIETGHMTSVMDIIEGGVGQDIWNDGTPILWLNELAASIRIFRAAQKTAGKLRVRMGDRTRDYQEMIYHLDALEALVSSIPEVNNMNWTYCTDRYHMKTQFGGWSFTPERYRVYYGIVNPFAELASMDPTKFETGAAAAILDGASIMSYEPILLTRRSAASDWALDVPADHMAVEIPVVHWLSDAPENRSEWLEMKEWCRSQTQRVVRPSWMDRPFGLDNVDGIFPLNPAVMEGSVMATSIQIESMLTVDKERTLSKVDGRICIPRSTLAERQNTGLSLFQLPDRSVLAELDPSYISEVPAGWKY